MKQNRSMLFIIRITGILILFTGILPVYISLLSAQEVIHVEATDSTFTMTTDSVTNLVISPDTISPGLIISPDTISGNTVLADSIVYEAILPDSTVREAFIAADSVFIAGADNTAINPAIRKSEFKPNSTRSVLYSAIFPGLGQIYNRKYWKLPIVYGGYMVFFYAITWNNRMYSDYQNAYKDIIDDATNRPEADPSQWHSSWKDFIPRGDYENYITNTTFQGQLKRRKDYYRRYRDLSIILAVGFYAICMIDAYVDAELFDFDVSPDLSMRIEPMIMPRTAFNQWTFGINYSITF